MKAGDRVKINMRGEPKYRYNRSKETQGKGFYFQDGETGTVIDPDYDHEYTIEDYINKAGYTFPLEVSHSGVMVAIDGEEIVFKEKDLELENEE